MDEEGLKLYLEKNLPDWQQAEPENVSEIVRLVMLYYRYKDESRLQICGLTENDELEPAANTAYTPQQWLYKILGLETSHRIQALTLLYKHAEVGTTCYIMDHHSTIERQKHQM